MEQSRLKLPTWRMFFVTQFYFQIVIDFIIAEENEFIKSFLQYAVKFAKPRKALKENSLSLTILRTREG